MVKTGIIFQNPRWQLSAILIAVARCFHAEALLYTTDHVSENNFDQTKIKTRKKMQFKIYSRKNFMMLNFFLSVYICKSMMSLF